MAIGLGSLAVCFSVALMASAGYLISRAAEHPPILSLTIAIIAVRFFGLARPVTRYAERIVSHDVALRGLARIRSRLFERIEPLAPAELEPFRRGDLLARMVEDVDAIQGLTLRGVEPPLVALSSGAACVVAAAWILPSAGVVLAVGLLLGGVAVPALSGWLARSTGHRERGARAELTAELVELLRGGPELVAFGCEDRVSERVRSAERELDRLRRRDAFVAGLGEALSLIVSGLTLVGVTACAVAARATGSLDRVLVATLALLALAAAEVVGPLPASARELSKILAAARRVLDLTDREPAVHDPTDPLPRPPVGAAVTIDGVAARYRGTSVPALEDVDLELMPGRSLALVGPSGGGKTTLTRVLLRFLDPERGTVTIGGSDLRDLRQEDVRRSFALAGQDAHLFDSTIRANLMLARPEATEAELVDALEQARLWAWVEAQPDGLDTFVGEEGSGLSGGQRQRLTIARALLARSSVLVLDEPTAHLDPSTARALIRDVLSSTGPGAVLLVTHRPEGLDLVDEVVRLEGGRTVPAGD
jgi:ATP-binding cassette, subfamily C, bacterial CydC